MFKLSIFILFILIILVEGVIEMVVYLKIYCDTCHFIFIKLNLILF